MKNNYRPYFDLARYPVEAPELRYHDEVIINDLLSKLYTHTPTTPTYYTILYFNKSRVNTITLDRGRGGGWRGAEIQKKKTTRGVKVYIPPTAEATGA